MSELPKGWLITEIGNVTTVVAGGTPKASDKSNFAESGEGIAWLTPADLSKYNKKSISNGARDLSPQGLKSSSAKLMPKGTILFSSRAPIGYSVIAENEIATNQGFKNFVLPEGVDSTYTYYYLKSIKHIAESMGTGTTFKELSGAVAKTLPFVLAPANEQIRIADKLDTILAKVDTAQARLDKIPNILKRFRQSVLAAATSGELTKEWALVHKLNKWDKLKLEDIAKIIDPQPSHRTPPVFEGGVPYIGIGDINKSGGFDFEQARKVAPTVLDEHRKRYQLKQGDFVFGKIGTIGKATLVPTNIDFTLSANLILVQPNLDNTSLGYVRYFLQSPNVMGEVAKQSKSTSQPAFGIKKMRVFEILLPSMIEQKEIVRRVESLFTMADIVEKQYNDAKTRTDRLTQSILAKAFRGELVSQEENDEPASVLLEKIQAELSKKTVKKKKLAPKKKIVKPKETKAQEAKQEVVKKEVANKKPSKEATTKVEKELTLSWSGKNAVYIDKAMKELKDTTFTTEQFQSVTGFSNAYEELKNLMLTLVKGMPGINEPLFEIADWDEKTGVYSFKLKSEK